MRSQLNFALMVTSLTATLLTAFAPAIASARSGKSAACVYETNDLGKIVGRGPTSAAAFEDAATQCFDRRSHLSKARNGQQLDEESGLAIIDVCANIKCS